MLPATANKTTEKNTKKRFKTTKTESAKTMVFTSLDTHTLSDSDVV